MTVLDTNVLSEVLKPLPSETVLGWLTAQDPRQVFVTTITQAEVLYGIELLPVGKRRKHLSDAAEAIFAIDFLSRILSFDAPSARVFAKITAKRQAMCRPISGFDAMIAAICLSCGAAIATRDARGFYGCDLKIINPWQQ